MRCTMRSIYIYIFFNEKNYFIVMKFILDRCFNAGQRGERNREEIN